MIYDTEEDVMFRKNVPSFDTLALDGTSKQRPWGNSLTVTSHDFSNYSHTDNDEAPLAYGVWWASALLQYRKSFRYEFNDQIDHRNICGGAFLLHMYGIGVDFERYVHDHSFLRSPAQ